MKSPLLPAAALFAIALSFSDTSPAEPTAVSIRVEQGTRSDMNSKDRINRTHSRALIVFITNNSGEPLTLKVKDIVFGRDMLKHELVTVGEGEKPVTVKPHTTERFEAAEAKVISSEQHWDPKAKKMIEAAGATIVGAGVQVSQADKVVAEWYDPASIKEQWGKTMPLPGTAPAKPAAAKPAATPAKK